MINILKENFFKSAFLFYSYASNLFFLTLDLLPHPIRNMAFKLLLAKLGKNVLIDYHVYFRYPKDIEIGNSASINRGCEFYTSSNLEAKIRIGNNVALAPHVKLYAAGHNYTKLSLPDTASDIVIEDNCWIGANVTILHGARIGEGSVIAAGSIVLGTIPPYSIAAGTPAKVIKKRIIS